MKKLRFILPFVLFSSFSFAQNQVQTASRTQPSQNTPEIQNNKEENTVEIRQTNERIVNKKQPVIIIKQSESQKEEINTISTPNKREIE